MDYSKFFIYEIHSLSRGQPASSHAFAITGFRFKYALTLLTGTRLKTQEKLTHFVHLNLNNPPKKKSNPASDINKNRY